MSAIPYTSSPNHRAPPTRSSSIHPPTSRRPSYASPVLAPPASPKPSLSGHHQQQQPAVSYSRPRTSTASTETGRREESHPVASRPSSPPPPPRNRQRSRSTTATARTTSSSRACSPPPPPPPPPPPLPRPFLVNKRAGNHPVSSSDDDSSTSSAHAHSKGLATPTLVPLPFSPVPTSPTAKRRSRSDSYAQPPIRGLGPAASEESVPPLPPMRASPLIQQDTWGDPSRDPAQRSRSKGSAISGSPRLGVTPRGPRGSPSQRTTEDAQMVAVGVLTDSPMSSPALGQQSQFSRHRERELEQIARAPHRDLDEGASTRLPSPPPSVDCTALDRDRPLPVRSSSHRKPPPTVPVAVPRSSRPEPPFDARAPGSPQPRPPPSPRPTAPPALSSPKPFAQVEGSPASSPPPGRPPRSLARRPSVSGSRYEGTALSPPPPLPALADDASPRPSPRIGKIRRPTISYPAPLEGDGVHAPPPLPMPAPTVSASPAFTPLAPQSTPAMAESPSDSMFIFFGGRPDVAEVAKMAEPASYVTGGRSRSGSVAAGSAHVNMRKSPHMPSAVATPTAAPSHYSTTSSRRPARPPVPQPLVAYTQLQDRPTKAPVSVATPAVSRPLPSIPIATPSLVPAEEAIEWATQTVVLDAELLDALIAGGANGRVHRRSSRRPDSLRPSPLVPSTASPVMPEDRDRTGTASAMRERSVGLGDRSSVLRRMSALKGLVGGLGLGFDMADDSGGSAGEGSRMVGDDDDQGPIEMGGIVEQDEDEEHTEDGADQTPVASPFVMNSAPAPSSPAFNIDLIARGLSKDRRSALYVAFGGPGADGGGRGDEDDDGDGEVIRFDDDGSRTVNKNDHIEYDTARGESAYLDTDEENRSSWPTSETTDIGDETFFSAIGPAAETSGTAAAHEQAHPWHAEEAAPELSVDESSSTMPAVIDAALKATRRRSRTHTVTRSSVVGPSSSPPELRPALPTPPPPPPPSPRPLQTMSPSSASVTPTVRPGERFPSSPLAPRSPAPAPAPAAAPSPARTWRESVGAETYEDLLDHYGSVEMKRQEVIWELCSTEEAFVSSMHAVLRLFARPLRTPQGLWIEGIPHEITRLFDWLYDIVHLHTDLCEALVQLREVQSPLVESLAEVVHPFAKRLDVHQPYLVKLEGVTHLIDRLVRDPTSDFGEFVRMQTESPECGSMSLNSHLLKAAQRLMKYPLFFKQLCHLTASHHPDHLPTLSLLHSTDSLIRVMEEVKAREEEYETIKSVQSRMRGLPDGFQLASRTRRLLGQGILHRVHFSSKDAAKETDHAHAYAQMHPAMPSPSTVGPNLSKLLPITLSANSPSPHQPSSHRGSVASGTGGYRASQGSILDRPGSTASESGVSCYSDASSIYSDFPSSSFPSSAFTLPPSPRRSTLHRQDSVSSSCPSSVDAHTSGYPSHWVPSLPAGGPGAAGGSSPSSLRSRSSKTKETAVHVFVFSDLVILASRSTVIVPAVPAPSPAGGGGSKNGKGRRGSLSAPSGGGTPATKEVHWKLLDGGVGICRVVGVVDQTGKAGFDHLLSLDLLPFTFTPPPDPRLPISSSTYHLPPAPVPTPHPITVHLTLPERHGRLALAPSRVLQQTRAKWLAAFEQSFLHTVQTSGDASEKVVLIGHGGGGGWGERDRSSPISWNGGGGNAIPRSPSDLSLAAFPSSPNPGTKSTSTSSARTALHHPSPTAHFDRDREERAWWSDRLRIVRSDMLYGEGIGGIGGSGGGGFGGFGGMGEEGLRSGREERERERGERMGKGGIGGVSPRMRFGR